MEGKIILTSLNRDELVDIFSTAIGGNVNNFYMEHMEEYEHLKGDACDYETGLANVLLAGGQVKVIDVASSEDDPTEDDFDSYKGHWQKSWVESVEYMSAYGIQEFNCVCYSITLQDIYDGISGSEEAYHYFKELLVDERGDMYTAWNIMQIVVFGEVIYG